MPKFRVAIEERKPKVKIYEVALRDAKGGIHEYTVEDHGHIVTISTVSGIHLGNVIGYDEDRKPGDAIDTHINKYVNTYF